MTAEQKRFKVTIEDQVDGEVIERDIDSLILVSLGDDREINDRVSEAAVEVSLMGHFNTSKIVAAITGMYSGIMDATDISIPVMKKVSDAAFKNLIMNSDLSSMLPKDAPPEARELFSKLDEITELMKKQMGAN